MSSIQGSSLNLSYQNLTSMPAAQNRIDTYMQHAYVMLNALESQNSGFDNIKNIYQEARKELDQIKEHLNRLPADSLSKHEIKLFAKELKHAQKSMAQVIKKTNREVLKTLSKLEDTAQKNKKIDYISRESPSFKLFNTVMRNLSNSWREAAVTYSHVKKELEEASHFDNLKSPLGESSTQIEKERLKDFENQDKKRVGVIKLGSQIRIVPEYKTKQIMKQLKSLQAQSISDKERPEIRTTIQSKDQKYDNCMIPLNAAFDKRIANKKISTASPFGEIFGTKGISTLNRQEKHLVNGFLSTFGDTYKTFRHGILSSFNSTSPERRKEESLKMAKELLTAVLFETLNSLDMTVDELKESEKPLSLNLSSVSLVTPDLIRSFSFLNQRSERELMMNQIAAFEEAIKSVQSLSVGGVDIKVNIGINAFNFGVNDGAVGNLSFAPGVKLGLDTQYKINQNAWEQLKENYLSLIKTVGNDLSQGPNEPLLLKAMKTLNEDIDHLMRSKDAYIKEGNQYEIGAKILNLTNLMTEYGKMHQDLLKEIDPPIPIVYSCAMNCFSGKDRTGVMDCVAKALHLMYLENKEFPTTHQLANDEIVKKRFGEILLNLLMKSGNLEITELNTDVQGYKVSEAANVAGIAIMDFINIKGLSKTTSS